MVLWLGESNLDFSSVVHGMQKNDQSQVDQGSEVYVMMGKSAMLMVQGGWL